MSRIRPLTGGTQMGPSGCTVGTTVLWNGQDVLLTNSHCSDMVNALDGEGFLQPASGADSLGYEVHDENGWWCGVFLDRKCRHADISAFSLVNPDTSSGEIWFRHGRVAR